MFTFDKAQNIFLFKDAILAPDTNLWTCPYFHFTIIKLFILPYAAKIFVSKIIRTTETERS